MGIFDPDEVITTYSLQEAIEDGVLIEIFKNRWSELSGGKPIVATAHLFESQRGGTAGDLERVRALEGVCGAHTAGGGTVVSHSHDWDDSVGDRGRGRLHADVS